MIILSTLLLAIRNYDNSRMNFKSSINDIKGGFALFCRRKDPERTRNYTA